MTRAELARELRKYTSALQSPRSMKSGPPYTVMLSGTALQRVVGNLEQAAALLEQEDRDARRYQVLRREMECQWWNLSDIRYVCVFIALIDLVSSNFPSKAPQQLDAALDAWIEKGKVE